MATYQELYDLRTNATLKNKITSACAVAAEAIRTESGGTANHANRLIWAKQAITDPEGMANKIIWSLLAQNVAATSAQIQAATDASILTAVQAVIDLFATGS